MKKNTKRLPSAKTARNRADSYLTPIIKSAHPNCMICGGETQVAHHFVNKSRSARLRYELINLIPLCHPCHQRLHHSESYWSGVILSRLGLRWFEGVSAMKGEVVKADVHWFLANAERLKGILNDLSTP